MKPSLLVALLAMSSACASVSPRESFDDVSRTLQDRGIRGAYWDQGTPADAQAQARVRELLAGTLTPESAVQIALLRNQGLIATYEELGIAQADLVQAGLLRNPTFGVQVRFPTRGGSTETNFSVSQDFLDLFTLPLRKRVAGTRLDSAKARVGNAVLELSSQVRKAMVVLQATQAQAKMRGLLLDAQQAAAELRRRQHGAGNIGDLELAQEEVFYQQEKLDLVRADTDVVVAREEVNRLMGVFGDESASWQAAETMAELPPQEPDLAHLESTAVARRLDLAAAASEVIALEQEASLGNATRVVPAFQAGVSVERDPEGNQVVGPEATVEVPIFDQGRARIARIEARLLQARARKQELAVNIRSEVRALRTRLQTQRMMVAHYQTALLPLRERLVSEAQLRYDAMLLGVFQLLVARRDQIETYRGYLDAVRDYWTTRADLERAAGGPLATAERKEGKP